MKKFINVLLICLISLFVISGMISCGNECEHIYNGCADTECDKCGNTRDSMHSWSEADCDTPKTCKTCGATEGNALGHEWTTPDVDLCKVQSTCSRCGATDGENVEHTWAAASCENAKICTQCKATDGEPLGHIPNEDDGNCQTPVTCQRCTEIIIEAQASHTPDEDDNSCETPVKCTVCDYIIVSAKVHDFSGEWITDTEGHWHKCVNEGCSVTDGSTEHIPSNEDNNCETPVKCTVCDYITVSAKVHDFSGEWITDTEGHWHKCINEGCANIDAKTNHTEGALATCMSGAICADCEAEYTEKDANNHISDKYSYISVSNTTHKKVHECNAVIYEETHIVDTSYEITYTWSSDYSSCTATGFCSLCKTNVIEDVSSVDEASCVSASFTVSGFEKQRFDKTTISFNSNGGSEIAPIVQLVGTKVTPPENPTRPGFTFAGWDKEIPTTMPAENMTLAAKWNAISYTVTWVDENGTVLEKDEGLSYGDTPVYNGQQPFKSATEEYSYRFNGWSPAVCPVSDNVTYKAVYEHILQNPIHPSLLMIQTTYQMKYQ